MKWPFSEYLVNRQDRIVYCPVPKVACCSLKQWFFDVAHLQRPPVPGMHAYIAANREQLGIAADEIALRNPEYFRFVFVRNPLSRLVSAYVDKFVRLSMSISPARRLVESIQRHRGRSVDVEEGVSFRDFAEHVIETPDERLDEHWCSQCVFVGDITFDVIGRYEHLQDDLQLIVKRAGLSHCPPLDALNVSCYAPRGNGECAADVRAGALRKLDRMPVWGDFCDAALRTGLCDRYAADFELLQRTECPKSLASSAI